MTAPAATGIYRGYWILSNASGKLFGIGTDASKPIWVEVNVSGSSPTVSGYDFAANACAAQWKSGAGIRLCPGTDGDVKGYAINRNFTQLEDGTMGAAPSILMAPDPKTTAIFRARTHSSQYCRAITSAVPLAVPEAPVVMAFRLDYMNSAGSVKTFWTWRESSDKKNNSFDLTWLLWRARTCALS